MIYSYPNYLPKGIRVSTYTFEKDTNIQSIAVHFGPFKFPQKYIKK